MSLHRYYCDLGAHQEST
ncbi:hypothetical protein D043_2497A, partial [Vibrio parahaemolyticus EKP-021]